MWQVENMTNHNQPLCFLKSSATCYKWSAFCAIFRNFISFSFNDKPVFPSKHESIFKRAGGAAAAIEFDHFLFFSNSIFSTPFRMQTLFHFMILKESAMFSSCFTCTISIIPCISLINNLANVMSASTYNCQLWSFGPIGRVT